MQRTWWPEAGTIIVTGPYCNVWLHRSCADLSLSGYNKLSNISASWRCYRCNCSNQPGSRYNSYEFEVSNPYDVLLSCLPSNSTDQDISLDSNFAGLSSDNCSTPVSNPRSQPNTANSQSQTFNMSTSGFSDRESSWSSRRRRHNYNANLLDLTLNRP